MTPEGFALLSSLFVPGITLTVGLSIWWIYIWKEKGPSRVYVRGLAALGIIIALPFIGILINVVFAGFTCPARIDEFGSVDNCMESQTMMGAILLAFYAVIAFVPAITAFVFVIASSIAAGSSKQKHLKGS